MRKLSIVASVVFTVVTSSCHSPISTKNQTELSALSNTVQKTGVVPPPMEILGQGARMPTLQELEQEQRFIEQQIELAGQWLKSPDAHRRVMGAEQLNAYQSPRAEQLLLDAWRRDKEPIVRKTACESLAVFKSLSEQTIDGLLASLNHADENTQRIALNTLLIYGKRVEFDTPKFQSMLAKFQKKLEANFLHLDVRHSLQAFVDDHRHNKNIENNNKP